jgi:hypothetical protein
MNATPKPDVEYSTEPASGGSGSIEYSTDGELIFGLREHEELSGVIARSSVEPVAPAAPDVSPDVVPLHDHLDHLQPLGEKKPFWNPKSDERHAKLRAKRKAERQARKKNRRNR